MRRATPSTILGIPNQVDFYPRSPCGERLTTAPIPAPIADFYPRSPCGERLTGRIPRIIQRFISIHALLAESDHSRLPSIPNACISIHALLAESDHNAGPLPTVCRDFYPRSPCGERLIPHQQKCRDRNFYPRSPCGERPVCSSQWTRACRFLSTLSLRRATDWRFPPDTGAQISIHALLAESDQRSCERVHKLFNFYPRSPCGERRFAISAHCFDGRISIHALLAESDWGPLNKRICNDDFYPRSPCGERPSRGQNRKN